MAHRDITSHCSCQILAWSEKSRLGAGLLITGIETPADLHARGTAQNAHEGPNVWLRHRELLENHQKAAFLVGCVDWWWLMWKTEGASVPRPLKGVGSTHGYSASQQAACHVHWYLVAKHVVNCYSQLTLSSVSVL